MTYTTVIIRQDDPQALTAAADEIRIGNAVAFPTDTVYGVGVRAFDHAAIDNLYAIKNRDASKPVAILLADPDQLPLVSSDIQPYASILASRFWPGAITLVVSRHPSLPENLSPLPTIGLRIPDHPFARALIRLTGPLAVSSANISGHTAATNAQEVFTQLEGSINLVIDGGNSPAGLASTVVDCTGNSFRILREGVINESAIIAALEL